MKRLHLARVRITGSVYRRDRQQFGFLFCRQVFPCRGHGGPQGVAAVRRNVDGEEQRERRRFGLKTEVTVPRTTEVECIAVGRLLQHFDDFRVVGAGFDERSRTRRSEPPRKFNLVAYAQVLPRKHHDFVFTDESAQTRNSLFVEPTNITDTDLGTEDAGESFRFHVRNLSVVNRRRNPSSCACSRRISRRDLRRAASEREPAVDAFQNLDRCAYLAESRDW